MRYHHGDIVDYADTPQRRAPAPTVLPIPRIPHNHLTVGDTDRMAFIRKRPAYSLDQFHRCFHRTPLECTKERIEGLMRLVRPEPTDRRHRRHPDFQPPNPGASK